MGQRTKQRWIFYLIMIALPLAQTAFFYVGVNLTSFIKAFQKYSAGVDGWNITFAGIENFKVALSFFKESGYMLKNSWTLYLVNTIVGLPLALFFSYYIYKKKPCSGLFRVFLFMPQIISGLIFSLLFKYIATDVFTYFGKMITGQEQMLGILDRGAETRFVSVLIFDVAVGFGAKILLYSGSMSAIDESVVESAHLDGVGVFQEIFYITLPMIYPTIVSFLVIGMAGFCTNQMHLFSMYGNSSKEIGTLGYYLYLQAQTASETHRTGYYSFSELSAVSLILSAIVVPTILGFKWLLNKVGPSVD